MQRDVAVTRRSMLGYALFGVTGAAVVGGAVGALAALMPDDPERIVVPFPRFEGSAPVYQRADPARPFFLVRFPGSADEAALARYPEPLRAALAAGVLALRVRCPYGDTMLPFCEWSSMFECPGCGSRFNAVGEFAGGRARRGMTLVLAVPTPDAQLAVTWDRSFPGLPAGVATMSTEPAGPHCMWSPESVRV